MGSAPSTYGICDIDALHKLMGKPQLSNQHVRCSSSGAQHVVAWLKPVSNDVTSCCAACSRLSRLRLASLCCTQSRDVSFAKS